MCGIVGIWQTSETNKQNLIKMCDRLIHRGPDSHGYYISPSRQVGLGFRRLSIIDLSDASNQPFSNQSGTKQIVFNGEIYNYKELRSNLQKSGHQFYSQGDAEVILLSYMEFGVKCLDQFHGMFAFAIWDDHNKHFFLARDRVGIKPLYYFHQPGIFLFASELKALIAHPAVSHEIDPSALSDYFTYGYIPYDKAIFKHVKKLPAGHYLLFQSDEVKIQKYWDLKYSPREQNETIVIEEIQYRLREAINLWSVSDVPIGIFLSGGLDSSTVCAFSDRQQVKDISTFSIGFDDTRTSELPYAKLISKYYDTRHHEKIVTIDDARPILPLISQVYDEPFYDASSIPTYYVSKFASKKLKVVLSGDGGDELFFGYNWYTNFLKLTSKSRNWGVNNNLLLTSFIDSFRRLPFSARIASVNKHLTLDPVQRYFRLIGFMDEWEKKQILSSCLNIQDSESLWLYHKFYQPDLPATVSLRLLDIKTYLVDDILTKVDRASMANSLEVRPPLLEHSFIEYMMTIPDEMIFNNRQKKYLLKKAVKDILPSAILNKKKQGFSSPIRYWLKNGLYEYSLERVCNGYAAKDGWLNPKAIRKMLNNYTENRWAKFWLILMFEEWYRKWIYNV